ncbi:MAG: universal stress protein [Myxococcota bacterium]|nr:universal stress protein [Myxococcota bacterium]
MAFATHILIPTDFSDASHLAIDAGGVLAAQLGAKVTLVHVHDPDALHPPATIGWSPKQQDDLDAEITDAVAKGLDDLRRSRLKTLENVETVILHDPSASQAICKYAEKIGADLIVLATHGRTGLKHLLIGSVAERVVRHSHVPVLTLRSHAED